MQEETLKRIVTLLEEIRDVSKQNRNNYMEAVKQAKKFRNITTPILIIVLVTWLYFVGISIFSSF